MALCIVCTEGRSTERETLDLRGQVGGGCLTGGRWPGRGTDLPSVYQLHIIRCGTKLIIACALWRVNIIVKVVVDVVSSSNITSCSTCSRVTCVLKLATTWRQHRPWQTATSLRSWQHTSCVARSCRPRARSSRC